MVLNKGDKILIFDSSSIINLSMNNLLDLLRKLKQLSKTRFVVPHSVKYETVKRPLKIRKFKLHALYVSKLFEENVFELPEAIGIKHSDVDSLKKRIMQVSNKLFFRGNRPIHMIDEGEAGCLAISIMLNKLNVDNVLVVDERTTRVLGENPENLKKLLERKLHTSVVHSRDHGNKEDNKLLEDIKKMKFIRSPELVFVAYKKDLLPKDGISKKEMLNAVLYATKFKGAAISDDEIKEIERAA